MAGTEEKPERLSLWWRNAVIIVVVVGFAVLSWISVRSYTDAPPIPERAVNQAGETVFTGGDIIDGQQVFLRYGLMENGTIWGHGAYLGPDFSAEYLHTLALDTAEAFARRLYGKELSRLTAEEKAAVYAEVQQSLKENRYSPDSRRLTLTPTEVASYSRQIGKWKAYFSESRDKQGAVKGSHQRPQRAATIDGIFCLDRLGFRNQSSRQVVHVHQ